MSHAASHLPLPDPPDADRRWMTPMRPGAAGAARCTYSGAYHDAVQRSLLTLKALSYYPTGGIVAAPTTSLPEQAGGSRNWDYRFCWLRDATFTLLALMHAGYREEAQAWGAWLRRSVAGTPAQLQTLYGIAGERWVQEWEVPWLDGYQGAAPVRVGNAASTQLQLDVYGELMDALYQEVGARAGAAVGELAAAAGPGEPSGDDLGPTGRKHLGGARRVAELHLLQGRWYGWRWIGRSGGAETFNLPAPLDRWRALRDAHPRDGVPRGLQRKAQQLRAVFRWRYAGRQPAAAAAGRFPAAGGSADPRHGGGDRAGPDGGRPGPALPHAPKPQDGLSGDEGVFLACSFWYVDNLVLQGRHAEARALFDRLLALANDVGLLAEEYDPVRKRQLGNFPQAFSHLALINSALNLDTHAGPATQRSQSEEADEPGAPGH